MGDTFYTESVNGYGRGFFAAALPRDDESFQGDPNAPKWRTWEDIFERAKQGDFTYTPMLVDLFGTMDLTLDGAITRLLAAAGSTQALGCACELIAGETQLEHIDICQALMLSGCLRYVPAVVDSYIRLQRDGWGELDIIPVRIRQALADPHQAFHDGVPLDKFSSAVLERHRELIQAHGSDDICVFAGEQVSPVHFAKELVRCANEGDDALLMPLRRQFEAYTGVDCSRFYNAARFPQWLNIAAIAEDFLARDDTQRFVAGRRYFFGHLVP